MRTYTVPSCGIPGPIVQRYGEPVCASPARPTFRAAHVQVSHVSPSGVFALSVVASLYRSNFGHEEALTIRGIAVRGAARPKGKPALYALPEGTRMVRAVRDVGGESTSRGSWTVNG